MAVAPGWSRKTEQLLRYVALRCRPGFPSELGHWLDSDPRFRAFITTRHDKIRKKLTTSDDEEHRLERRGRAARGYRCLSREFAEVLTPPGAYTPSFAVDEAHVVPPVVSGDTGAVAALRRAPLAPAAFLQEEQHAAGRSAHAQSLALWTSQQVDARSSDTRTRDNAWLVGYLDTRAAGYLAVPVQSRPAGRRRAELVQQRHGRGRGRPALHRGGEQLADGAAQRAKPVQLTGGCGARRPRDTQVVEAEPGREVGWCGEPVVHLTIDGKDGAGQLEGQRRVPERILRQHCLMVSVIANH